MPYTAYGARYRGHRRPSIDKEGSFRARVAPDTAFATTAKGFDKTAPASA